MLDQGARGRHEYRLVAVYPPHQIRGPAIGAMNLGDDTFPVSVARVTAPDHDLVSHFCAHLFPPYHRCRQPDLRTDGQTGPKVRTAGASGWLSAPDVPCAKTARSGTATGSPAMAKFSWRPAHRIRVSRVATSRSGPNVLAGDSRRPAEVTGSPVVSRSQRETKEPLCLLEHRLYRDFTPITAGRNAAYLPRMPAGSGGTRINAECEYIVVMNWAFADPCKQVGNFRTECYLTPYDRYDHASDQRPAAAGDGRRAYGVGLAGSAVRKRAAAHVRVPMGLFPD